MDCYIAELPAISDDLLISHCQVLTYVGMVCQGVGSHNSGRLKIHQEVILPNGFYILIAPFI